VRRGRTLGKRYGIFFKKGAIQNTLGEHHGELGEQGANTRIKKFHPHTPS
jgi:hypothetical protein